MPYSADAALNTLYLKTPRRLSMGMQSPRLTIVAGKFANVRPREATMREMLARNNSLPVTANIHFCS